MICGNLLLFVMMIVMLWLWYRLMNCGMWKLLWCILIVWCSVRLFVLVGRSFRKVVKFVVLNFFVVMNC